MQNHFNTVFTQTPQIILECSEWIQYELRDFYLPPRRCVWARLAGMLPALESWGFHLSDLSEWGTEEGKAGWQHSTSAYQKSKPEIFKNSYKELNSPSAQYMPVYLFPIWQAGQGLVSPPGFPCFGNSFCVSHHSNTALWAIPDTAPPNLISKVILINIITLLRKHLFCQVSNYFSHFIYFPYHL